MNLSSRLTQILMEYRPPPVSQMVDPAKGTSTPPVELPARKIMRRDDGKSGTNTTANSQNPSKTTSEVGGSEGSNDGNDGKDKDLKNLTREEREARYREARQRIFGSAETEENETNESTGSGEEKEKEKDVSRSSSTNGKKKTKKQRNYDDDDFQARSRFNAYYPQQYPNPGYSSDNVVYYNGFPGPMQNPQYPGINPGASPQAVYSNPYPTMVGPEAQGQYGWNQHYQPTNNQMMYPSYGAAQNNFDLSTEFQRGMSSFQNASVPSQVTPKMGNIAMAPYQDPYQQPQHMNMNSGWSPVPQQPPSYPMAQNPYASPGPGNRPMSAPSQGPMPTSYPYGQFPANPYGGKMNHNQHPIPGSYNRQQFNPQSQAFVPGGRPMPFPMQPGMNQGLPQMNGYHGHPPGPNGMQQQLPRVSPSAASTTSFGSPQSLQGTNGAGVMHRIASQSGEPTSTQSSIAKYGTPSHLPARPPAPATPQATPPKLPSVARPPNNMVVSS